MNPQVDITVNRSGGDPCSADAHRIIVPRKERMQRKVESIIWSCGYAGATSKEIALALRVELNTISGRCTELVAEGRVVKTDRRREGCAVLMATSQQGRLL